MTDWAYRATATGAGIDATKRILRDHAFLWRPLFKNASKTARDGLPPLHSYLARIDPPADRLFVFFSERGDLKCLGAFRFATSRPAAHPFGRAPAVCRVEQNDDLNQALKDAGYGKDPFLRCYTGFELEPLGQGVARLGHPHFARRSAIGTFAPVRATEVPLPLQDSASPQCDTSPVCGPNSEEACCYGVDWSGASVAGDKIRVAELDPVRRAIIRVTRPWSGQSVDQCIGRMSAWLASLVQGWVACDFPFGLAVADRLRLLGSTDLDPRSWAARLVHRYVKVSAFIAEAKTAQLLGRNRRLTDRDAKAPLAPLDIRIIYQTHAGQRLLAQLPRTVSVLPWDARSSMAVCLVEACPASLLRALGLDSRGYKGDDGTPCARRALLSEALQRTGWPRAPNEVENAVADDPEGDALDAVLAGLAAWRASETDHNAVARMPSRLAEGHIYC